MDLNKKIELAQVIQQHINTHAGDLWPGFTPIPFILYDGDNQVAVGENWPGHYRLEKDNIWVAEGLDPILMGNTVAMYHGRSVAICDTRTWYEASLSEAEATACIAHEMFHEFQINNMSLPYANELLLPDYPHTPKSLNFVIEENKLLIHLFANLNSYDEVRDGLALIAMLRRLRKEEIGADYFEYDCNMEGFEGVSAYIEIKMRSKLEGRSPFEAANSYLSILTQNNNLLKKYRHRCYSVGMILCFAADIVCPEWKTEWPRSKQPLFCDDFGTMPEASKSSQKQPLFNWLNEKIDLDSPINQAKEIIDNFEQDKSSLINEFKSQPLTLIEGSINILSFDPMNLTCFGGFCLHKHGKVRYNNEEHLLTEPFLTEYSGNIMNVVRMWVSALHDR